MKSTTIAVYPRLLAYASDCGRSLTVVIVPALVVAFLIGLAVGGISYLYPPIEELSFFWYLLPGAVWGCVVFGGTIVSWWRGLTKGLKIEIDVGTDSLRSHWVDTNLGTLTDDGVIPNNPFGRSAVYVKVVDFSRIGRFSGRYFHIVAHYMKEDDDEQRYVEVICHIDKLYWRIPKESQRNIESLIEGIKQQDEMQWTERRNSGPLHQVT